MEWSGACSLKILPLVGCLVFLFIAILEVLSLINSKHLEKYSQNALFLL